MLFILKFYQTWHIYDLLLFVYPYWIENCEFTDFINQNIYFLYENVLVFKLQRKIEIMYIYKFTNTDML